MKSGYIIENVKKNSLLFMNDHKSVSNNGKEINSLVSIIQALAETLP